MLVEAASVSKIGVTWASPDDDPENSLPLFHSGYRVHWERCTSYDKTFANSNGSNDPDAALFGALCLTADAPPPVVRAAYKALAMIEHPDRGGDLERMKTINGAYQDLKAKGKAT